MQYWKHHPKMWKPGPKAVSISNVCPCKTIGNDISSLRLPEKKPCTGLQEFLSTVRHSKWQTVVVATTWEVEAGGLLEPKSLRLPWPILRLLSPKEKQTKGFNVIAK